MKFFGLFLGISMVFAGVNPVSAAVRKACFVKAAAAVERQAKPGYYDEGSSETFKCELAPNKRSTLCEVGILKGDGEASDTFLVVLNTECTKVYRVELIDEE